MISIIVAIASNGAIGRNNQLLWHISEDLRYFKKITGGHTVIMGRKTWESIGRPLPNRRNIVVSRNIDAAKLAGAEVYRSMEEAVAAASANKNLQSDGLCTNNQSDEPLIFIIGGGEIYRQALPLADRLYLTLVHTPIDDADTFFPAIDYTQWREVSRESFPRGEKFEHPFDFVVLKRK
jgi:dihydrofolate reductase